MGNNKKSDPTDLQITLITTGLIVLGIIAVGGLILNAVNPNFHLLSSGGQLKEQEVETETQEVPTTPPVVDEKIATESAQQATESSEQASPSGEQASPSAVVEPAGPTCVTCGD